MGQLSPSGISGPKLTALERAVDEIIDFERPVQEEPVDGEYMNENRGSVSAFAEHYLFSTYFFLQTRKLTGAEKKRAGQLIRDQVMSFLI